MIIKGLDKFSLIDYPGKIAAIVFVAGCNFRCPYCHNPHLVIEGSAQPRLSEKAVFDFLESRRGKIDGVVISGGEPTLQKNLTLFVEKLKYIGYQTKIDTNASHPDIIKNLIDADLLDAVGIDYKAPRKKYNEIVKFYDDELWENIAETIRFCLEKNKLLDLKTTVHKKILSFDDLLEMRSELDQIGAKDWILQQFHHSEMIDNSLKDEETYSDLELANFAKKIHNTKARGIKGLFLE